MCVCAYTVSMRPNVCSVFKCAFVFCYHALLYITNHTRPHYAPTQVDKSLSTPLIHAVWDGKFDIIELIVNAGADVNVQVSGVKY